MSKLIDVGLGKSKEQAKIDRVKAWKRPKTKTAREKQRKDRVTNLKEVYGIAADIQE